MLETEAIWERLANVRRRSLSERATESPRSLSGAAASAPETYPAKTQEDVGECRG